MQPDLLTMPESTPPPYPPPLPFQIVNYIVAKKPAPVRPKRRIRPLVFVRLTQKRPSDLVHKIISKLGRETTMLAIWGEARLTKLKKRNLGMPQRLSKKTNEMIASLFWRSRKLSIARRQMFNHLLDISQSPTKVFQILGVTVMFLGVLLLSLSLSVGVILIIAGLLQLGLGKFLRLKIG